jgi:hypothetical protein
MPSGGRVAISPGPPVDQFGCRGEIPGGAGSIPGAFGCGCRGPQQPQRIDTEVPGLRGSCGAAQCGRRGPVVPGELRGLLVAALRLPGEAAGEAQVAEQDRQPVRLVAPGGLGGRPADGTAQFVGDVVVRRAPRACVVGGIRAEGSADLQTPAEVAGVGLGGLIGLVQPLGAILADGLQRAVAGAAR